MDFRNPSRPKGPTQGQLSTAKVSRVPEGPSLGEVSASHSFAPWPSLRLPFAEIPLGPAIARARSKRLGDMGNPKSLTVETEVSVGGGFT